MTVNKVLILQHLQKASQNAKKPVLKDERELFAP
jgi:hypothetical protein